MNGTFRIADQNELILNIKNCVYMNVASVLYIISANKMRFKKRTNTKPQIKDRMKIEAPIGSILKTFKCLGKEMLLDWV